MMTDPYSVLGVSPTATHAEITHAYRRYLRDDHPDIRVPAVEFRSRRAVAASFGSLCPAT